jgi:cell division protease FtsH
MPELQKNPQKTPPQGPENRSPWSFSIWWLILIALLVWNFFGVQPSTKPEAAKIPYSVFIDQVKANNVAEVYIRGDEIGGHFVKPVLWPPAEKAAKSAKASSSKASANQQTSAPGATAGQPEGTQSGSAPANQANPSEPAKSATAPVNQTNRPQAGKSKLPPRPEPKQYRDFLTTFPEEIGDPDLLPLLESHNVEIKAYPPPNPWLSNLLISILPLLLLVGFFWWMGRRAVRQQGSIFGFGQQKAKRYDSSQPGVTFDDVAGADSAKQQLQEEVDFLSHPEKYHELGARIPRGVLLVGPPGTGKTLLARAVAGEAHVPFFSISGSEFVEMFVGVGASRVRDLFRQAKEAAPAIMFIDELDAVGRRRGAGVGMVNDEREQTLNQLLVEMDGFDARNEVIVLAATNRPDVLDPALQRPGRFDRQVVVGLPDRRGREGILRIHSRPLQLAEDVDLAVLAGSTMGMSGAQLANLCNEGALIAARKGHSKVAMADFEAAIDKVILGDVLPLVLDEHARRVTAYHESGHAVVAWLIPEADPVHKVTIIPHGQALGVTKQLPGEDRYSYSESYLKARLAVMLGGRSAEEIVMGDVTTGAENDLLQATRLARQMVTSWGMGSLGLVAYPSHDDNRFLGYELAQGKEFSEATATRLDRDVQELLEERHQVVLKLLNEKRHLLDQLTDALLKQESVEHEELVQILGPRPKPAQPRVSKAMVINE